MKWMVWELHCNKIFFLSRLLTYGIADWGRSSANSSKRQARHWTKVSKTTILRLCKLTNNIQQICRDYPWEKKLTPNSKDNESLILLPGATPTLLPSLSSNSMVVPAARTSSFAFGGAHLIGVEYSETPHSAVTVPISELWENIFWLFKTTQFVALFLLQQRGK